MFITSTNRKHNWQDFTLIVRFLAMLSSPAPNNSIAVLLGFIPSALKMIFVPVEISVDRGGPTVSVGNVGQLAADLIISTLWMERVGYLYHPALLPVVGNNPFAHEDATSCKITTCCEVYESILAEIVVIQQRAPFVKGKKKEYADWLSNWIKERKFHQVVVITGSFAQERLDHQLSGSPFRILKSPKMDEHWGNFFSTKMQWQELEKRPAFPAPTPSELQSNSHRLQDEKLYMPGSGIAKHLFDNCQNMAVLVLLMFVSEGDNGQDAIDFADQINIWLNLIDKKEKGGGNKVLSQDVAKGIKKWKIPMSWRLVFGSRFDQKLFQ